MPKRHSLTQKQKQKKRFWDQSFELLQSCFGQDCFVFTPKSALLDPSRVPLSPLYLFTIHFFPQQGFFIYFNLDGLSKVLNSSTFYY